MKPFILIIVLILAIIAWPKAEKILKAPPPPAPSDLEVPQPPVPLEPVAPERPAQAAKKAAPVRTRWKRDELVIVHGKVISSQGNVAQIQCTPREYDGLHRVQVQGDLPAGDGSRLGQHAIDIDNRIYGPLKTVVNGVVQKADRSPARYARGKITLRGCPGRTGAAINMVAGPISETEYTTVIEIDETNSSWMWNGGSTALDRKPKK